MAGPATPEALADIERQIQGECEAADRTVAHNARALRLAVEHLEVALAGKGLIARTLTGETLAELRADALFHAVARRDLAYERLGWIKRIRGTMAP